MIQTLEYLALRESLVSHTARTLKLSSQEERLRSTRFAQERKAATGDANSQSKANASLPPKPRSLPRYTTITVPEARAQPGAGKLQRQPTLAGRVQNVKPPSLREVATRFRINDLPIIFRQQIVAIWGPYLSGRILGLDETFADKVRIEVDNSMANFY